MFVTASLLMASLMLVQHAGLLTATDPFHESLASENAAYCANLPAYLKWNGSGLAQPGSGNGLIASLAALCRQTGYLH